MNGKYNIVKKEYTTFKQKFENEIISDNISSDECIFVKDSWDLILNNKLNEEKEKNKFYFKKGPEIIDNILPLLENNIRLKIENKKIIELIFPGYLKSCNVYKYYAGYNKLIFEYKENSVINSFLVVNSLEILNKNHNLCVVAFQNKEKDTKLYENILSKKINLSNNLKNNLKFRNVIITNFKEIININNVNNLFEQLNNYNFSIIFKNDILKIFIYIFYFNKNLNKEEKNIIFNENKEYYLINPEWFNLYKEYYNYKEIEDHLKTYDKGNININYYNLESNIYNIIESFLNKNINSKKLLFLEYNNSNNMDRIPMEKSDIEIHKNFYIISPKIFEMINLYEYKNNQISIKSKKFFFENDEIFLIDNKNIIVVEMNEEYLFIPKYIFSFNSIEIMELEINNLKKNKININKYIELRKCKINNNNTQSLINEKNSSIGTFINLKKYQEEKEINKSIKEELNKTKNNLKLYEEKQKELKKNNIEKNKEITELNKINENQKKIIQELKFKIEEEKNKDNNKEINSNYDKIKNELKDKEKKLIDTEQNNLIIKQKLEEEKKNNEKLNEENKLLKINENNYIKKLEEYKIKEKEINEKNESQKEEINKKLKEISVKEKEVNDKITFLEDKENIIEKENKNMEIKIEQFKKDKEENIKIKNEINILNKNKLDLEKEIKEMKKHFYSLNNSPILIGLNNIGATCFMNSTLQCLSQTKQLTDFFLNENNHNELSLLENKNVVQLFPVYMELIQKLWEKGDSKSYSPYNFMNVVEKMNPLFKKGQAGDSKDFIIFILEQLHKELKYSNSQNELLSKQPLNQYDKNNALNFFFEEFKRQTSIISDIFFGFSETTNECLNCKNIYNLQGLNNPICYNYGIFNCLIFPLEEVKKYKNSLINSFNLIQMNQNNNVSIYECFYYNQKTDLFTGENKNYCNICKQLYDSNYTSKIFISPNVLILILNRGKGNIYNVKLDILETIDITQFVLKKEKPQIIYNLYGVITHIGESGPNAHFIASCKSSVDNKWYRFNDAIVIPIKDPQKEVFEFGIPYILFYKKI